MVHGLHLFALVITVVVVNSGFLSFVSSAKRAEASDLRAHEENQNDFISDIDTNGRDGVSLLELKKAIKIIGGEQFDESQEISNAAEQSYARMNSDNDAYLSKSELRRGFQLQEERLATIEEFQLYLAHGVHLREEERAKFRVHEIKGNDILGLGLTQNNCRDLKASDGLNITSIVDTKRLCRSFFSFLMQLVPAPVLLPGGHGDFPGVNFTASASREGRVRLSWPTLASVAPACPAAHEHVCPDRAEGGGGTYAGHVLPREHGEGTCNHTCHRPRSPVAPSDEGGAGVPMEFVLRRQEIRTGEEDDGEGDGNDGTFSGGEWGGADWGPWKLVWSGAKRFEYVDKTVLPNKAYRYQLSAWNEGGRSEYLLANVRTAPLGWMHHLRAGAVAVGANVLNSDPQQVLYSALFGLIGFAVGCTVTKYGAAQVPDSGTGLGRSDSVASVASSSARDSRKAQAGADPASYAPLVQNRWGPDGVVVCHIADSISHQHKREMTEERDNCYWCGVRVKINAVTSKKKYECANCRRVFCDNCGYTQGSKCHCSLCRAALGKRNNLQSRPSSAARARPALSRAASEASDASDDSSVGAPSNPPVSATVHPVPAATTLVALPPLGSPPPVRPTGPSGAPPPAIPAAAAARAGSPGLFGERRPPLSAPSSMRSLGKGIANQLGLRPSNKQS